MYVSIILQALNALLQIQQGLEQLRTAAPSLVGNLGLGVGNATATPTTTPPAPAAPPNAPPRQQQNSELFTQVVLYNIIASNILSVN